MESESRLDLGSSKLSTELEMPQGARVAETATALAFRRRWLILGVVLVGSFMAILDVFIVTQGLPSRPVSALVSPILSLWYQRTRSSMPSS